MALLFYCFEARGIVIVLDHVMPRCVKVAASAPRADSVNVVRSGPDCPSATAARTANVTTIRVTTTMENCVAVRITKQKTIDHVLN